MTITSVLSALLVAGASSACWVPARAARQRIGVPDRLTEHRRLEWFLPVGTALVIPLLFNGLSGLVLGVVMGLGIHRWRGAWGRRHDKTDATRRTLALPVTLDVLSACLSVGASNWQALDAVGSGVRGTLGHDLRAVAGAIHLGADVTEAWTLVDAPDLDALGAILARAEISGSAVTPLLALLADQQRQRARVTAMDAARTLGVRVTAPLGLCFLPAFVLIAVVPLVISLLPLSL